MKKEEYIGHEIPSTSRGKYTVKSNYHLAGIIPIIDKLENIDYYPELPHYLLNISENYTPIDRAVNECAWAGCDTIWLVCPFEMIPLVKRRLGEWVEDYNKVLLGKEKENLSLEHILKYRKYYHVKKYKYSRKIPLFYVAIPVNDRGKRDTLGWSIMYGAKIASKVTRTVSKWVSPDKYFVSFPYGVYPEIFVSSYRKRLRDNVNLLFTSNGKTVKDNEYLSFTFTPIDLRKIIHSARREKKNIKYLSYKNGEKIKKYPERDFPLSFYFSFLNDVFIRKIEVPFYDKIDTWKGYCDLLGSERWKKLKTFQEYNVKKGSKRWWYSYVGDDEISKDIIGEEKEEEETESENK